MAVVKNDANDKAAIRKLFEVLMNASNEQVKKSIHAILKSIDGKQHERGSAEELVERL